MLTIVNNLDECEILKNKVIEIVKRDRLNNRPFKFFYEDAKKGFYIKNPDNDNWFDWEPSSDDDIKAIWDANDVEPEVGMLATIHYYSDSRGVKIVEVSKNKKEIKVAHLKYTMPNGLYDGHGECTDEIYGEYETFTKRKRYWIKKGERLNDGLVLSIGHAHTFIDPSF